MQRRDFFASMSALPAVAAEQYTSRARGLPPLTIRNVRVITTGAGRGYQWVFVKVETSEPGLYGIGSASNLGQAATVAEAIEKYYVPFWIGKDPDRIEDLWQNTHVRCYWWISGSRQYHAAHRIGSRCLLFGAGHDEVGDSLARQAPKSTLLPLRPLLGASFTV